MIQIIPSITVINGKSTRLLQGNFMNETVYDSSPIEVAKEFEDNGIKQIHLVDLDGARRGSPVNYGTLEIIAGHTNLKIDFTGGISTDGDISKAYEYGASYITAASVAVTRKEHFASWIISYGRENITLGADALNKKIHIRGWQRQTAIDLFEHIDYFYNRGLKYVKVSDIPREGSMTGPAFALYKEIIEEFPGICLLASGGVRSVDDIERLQEIGAWGVIFGKAYYENKLKLEDLKGFLI
ncbi:MAG: 1-(5-phosphoribosyl)-5-[(5-phosphoribosylamino)methylideneamino] imidazole-4-carboxamide isomerase [Bacteroidota bacterium]|jgi:phosphoribosylformimino-5-aminoimidazole carboxamide ribotide isomerase|nr:1-(5-phosphoribosyl)-5-[(5-phosphoribosylamino)methylideneamino] imidazole-4-carboxamide isomerase [Bacteroidota bacterium]